MSNSALVNNFKKWACSFSGCDGGIRDKGIWFSGIEWGIEKDKQQNYYESELLKEIGEGEYSPKKIYDHEYHLSYQFGVKMAKLYSVIKGRKITEYKENAKEMEKDVFKVNLYPISFNNDSDELWETYKLSDITGLESKLIYRTWCFLHRFPWISEQVNASKPKVIICTGVSYLTDFVVCFAGKEGVENIHKISIIPQSDKNGKVRYMYWAKLNNDSNTILIVLPFFGGVHGLNSDYLIQQCGIKIKELMNDGYLGSELK